MADFGCAYPPPPMVGTYTSHPPLPPRTRPLKTRSMAWPVLVALLILALGGMAVEACFIYDLYQKVDPSAKGDAPLGHEKQIQVNMSSDSMKKPSKPMAHLIGASKPRKDGIILWEVEERMDVTIMHKMKYDNGKIIIQKEGYYAIYSKMYFKETQQRLILHEVVKTTPRYPKEIVLLRSKRFPPKDTHAGHTNSYLGGVFHLFEKEAIFVKVNNRTEVTLLQPADNYFGAYMV
ncbi:tumor necrosis factor ligand superfamily member 14-like [Alosa sapidissima]|uniref:tumor necrosis factor ligand superfamily member 14-like n=1 Tax=Alosa sapidissima TaxID=34773 RepID=UPI001C086616|nr:tumor necrosis factor ligand superfamily member 14-like [Alosa sapidissima]